MTAGNTVLEIRAPEIESAEASGWDASFRVLKDRAVPAGAGVRGRQTRGQAPVLHATYRAMAPGLYRVVGSAIAEPATVEREGAPYVRDAIFAEVWLYVDERGGRVLDEFDPTVIPEGYPTQPGPFIRPLTRQQAEELRGAEQATTGLSWGQSDGWIGYYDKDAGRYLGIVDHSISFDFYNWEGNGYQPVGGATATSIAHGAFSFDCPMQYDAMKVTASPSSFPIQMMNGPVSTHWYFSCAGIPQTLQLILPSDHTKVMLNMRENYRHAVQLFGRGRGWVNVNLLYSGGVSRYVAYLFTERIDIVADNANHHHGNDIWGWWGKWVAGHEFGHAYHNTALGGNTASNQCESPHYWDGAYNLQCAFSEVSHISLPQ
jgi:hypothetical protein